MVTASSAPFTLPKVPVPHQDFVSYIEKHGANHHILDPYNKYEARLREGFAQHGGDNALKDPMINAVPIFGSNKPLLRVESRKADDQTLNDKCIMSLKAKDRKRAGAPATVADMQEFKKNFNLFSESSLVDLDWNNVIAAGSSVVTSLLPVSQEVSKSKKAQR